MRTLVTAASRHGATKEIAGAIAQTLRAHGHDVEFADPDEVDDLIGIEAAVIGSAVYAGHWLKPALKLIEKHQAALSQRPVWLFSSGPIGDPPEPSEDPVDVEPLIRMVAARDHKLFAGRLDKGRLTFPERAMVVALRSPTGDFRDWVEIRDFADDIARELHGANEHPAAQS